MTSGGRGSKGSSRASGSSYRNVFDGGRVFGGGGDGAALLACVRVGGPGEAPGGFVE